ncbi:MAG TPA: TrkA C-terminal domain-containing protein [Mariprofundaceae bacterium]|nr:TrkA C-terminal domain-containing protein [Mariprofundaceae bacterium]
MSGLYLLFPTLLAIFFSLLFVRAGAIGLMLTGMRYERAKFQALSAFSGTGFTTREAEHVVNHPTRRKIISTLMIGGNAGIVTVIVTATTSFAVTPGYDIIFNVLALVLGLALIYAIARHAGFMGRWESIVEHWLERHSTTFEYAPVEELLHLAEGFGLVKLEIAEESSLVGQSIIEIGGTHPDTLVLGIERDRNWIPARHLLHDPIEADDRLIIYGRLSKLREEFDSA